MITYNFDTIIEISHKDISYLKINISEFIKNYHLIERADKYEPIFSLTQKYKSFPVNSKRPTKNFFQNNKWKIKNVDINQLNLNIKLLLNKLSKNNVEFIKDEIIKLVTDNFNKNIIKIFTTELLNKVWFDEILLNEYIFICEEIWNLSNFKDKNIKQKIIQQFLYEFNNRETYIQNILKDKNEDTIFVLKRKLYGTVELLSKLYIKKHINNDTMKQILNTLLKDEMTIFDYESFYSLWSIIKDNNHLSNNDITYYKNYLTNKLRTFDNKRLKLLIEMILENKNDSSDNILYINNCLKEYKLNNNLDEIYSKLKVVDEEIVINEVIITQFDNDFSFIELLNKFNNQTLIVDIINNLNIEELSIDIPDIKSKVINLQNELSKYS